VSPKTRAIAAQAIGVVILGAVVYFAFLKPGNPGTLSEIEVNDGVTVEAPRPSVHHPRRQQPGAKPRDTAAPRHAPGPATAATPEKTTPPPETPVGSQYADAVARILDSVARGAP
jgi:hypothetical protein